MMKLTSKFKLVTALGLLLLFCTTCIFSQQPISAASVCSGLENKKVLIDGDGIYTTELKNYLKNTCNMKVTSIAASGSNFYSGSMSNHLTSTVKKTEYDYIIISAGTNDSRKSANYDQSYKKITNYLDTVRKNKKWATAKILFVIPPKSNYKDKYNETKAATLQNNEKKFWDKVNGICSYYSIPVINFSNTVLKKPNNSNNGLTPSSSIKEKVAKNITKEMSRNLPQYKYTVTFRVYQNRGKVINRSNKEKSSFSETVLHNEKISKQPGVVFNKKNQYQLYCWTDHPNPDDIERKELCKNHKFRFSSPITENKTITAVYKKSEQGDVPEIINNIENADSDDPAGSGESSGLASSIQKILNRIIGVVGLLAVVFVIVGGIQYMTSSGDTAKIDKAKKTILYSGIGLVISALSFAIVNWVIVELIH